MEGIPGTGRAYITTRVVTRKECPWLDRDIAPDELFLPASDPYGCCGPTGVMVAYTKADWEAVNDARVACGDVPLDPSYGFELPAEALRTVMVD